MMAEHGSHWEMQFRGRVRFHMLECWLDSFQAARSRQMPGCGVRDVFAEGRAGEWATYVGADDAALMADRGLEFVRDRRALAAHDSLTAEVVARSADAARECTRTALSFGVPHPGTAAAFVRYFEAYTVLQGHFQATSPLFTAGAERVLAGALARAPGRAEEVLAYAAPGGLKAAMEPLRWWEQVVASHEEEWTPAGVLDMVRRHVDRFGPTGALGDGSEDALFQACMRRWERDVALAPERLQGQLAEAERTLDRGIEARHEAARQLGLDEDTITIADNLGRLGLRREAIRNEASRVTQLAYGGFEVVFALVGAELGGWEGFRQLSRAEIIDLAGGVAVDLGSVLQRLRHGFCRFRVARHDCLAGEAALAAAESVRAIR